MNRPSNSPTEKFVADTSRRHCILSLRIEMCPITKKNSLRILGRGSRKWIGQSRAYEEYEAAAVKLLSGSAHGIDYPVTVRARYYMQTRRRVDLSNLNSALDDVLVAAGVIADDNRDIVASHDGSRVYYDKENPRTEIEIEPFTEEYERFGKT